MLYKWTCLSSRRSYGDLTAAHLRELAENRTIQPADSIGCFGQLVAAYKFRNLFPKAAFLEINWRGSPDGSTTPVTVSLNNHVLGTAQIGPGFCFWHEVQRRQQHLVGVKLPLKSQKQYVINIPRAGIYCCDLIFGGGFWANFKDECNVYDQPARFLGEDQTFNAWEEERQAAQCRHCGAEWSVVHLGQKVLEEKQKLRNTSDPQYQMVVRPDQNPYIPYPQYDKVLVGFQPSQYIAVVTTTRHFFQCNSCGKKWHHQETRETP